ncbi:DNA adenine methylase [Desulfococcaceae bacterium HSG8]|nr:DNA adenine methylase [Desulfococcaceae bacterium HSG8]
MQLNISEFPSDTNIVENLKPKPFRTLHYLGSKLRMLDFIKKVANKEDPDQGAICDLFAGSGAVSQYLSNYRRIVAVDIQKYSEVICTALLKPCSDKKILLYGDYSRKSSIKAIFKEILKPITEYESQAMERGEHGDIEPLCDFLEHCSLYSASEYSATQGMSDLKSALSKTITNIKNFGRPAFLATTYFGGIYFSYKQTMCIDVILYETKRAPIEFQNTLMAALLSTASDIVNTVGKQFAQPIRPRNKNGEPKSRLISQLKKDREICVFKTFENWLRKYLRENSYSAKHEILCADYNEAINSVAEDVSIVYADPPYTRDHYSRFYHGLETICLNDFPKISKINIGGTMRLSRGLYRKNRHQSPFCIKSKAPEAFKNLFKKVARKGKILMLSYSPYNKSKNAHPRVMQIENLFSLAGRYFKYVESYSPGVFSHSKLNNTEKHLEANDNGELILVCRN